MKSTEITPAKTSWFRKHRTGIIASGVAVIVIAGLAVGAVAYGGQIIDQVTSSVPKAGAADLWGTGSHTATKATATSAPMKPAAAKVVAGQTLTAQQASKIRRNFKGDLHAYQMADGSYVAVSASQPLPAPVSADIAAQASAAVDAGIAASGHNNPSPMEDAAAHSVASADYETGRSVILLVRFYSYLDSTRAPGYWWAPVQNSQVRPNVGGPVQLPSREAALAAAQKFVAAQEDPSIWDIVG